MQDLFLDDIFRGFSPPDFCRSSHVFGFSRIIPPIVNPLKTKVYIGYSEWLSSYLNREVLSILVREHFGHPVEFTPAVGEDIVVGMAAGINDIHWEMWETRSKEMAGALQDPSVGYGNDFFLVFPSFLLWCLTPVFSRCQVGNLGVEGRIGWYIPSYLLDYNPELANWRSLR